jgi:glutaredoxin-like YruB-family protein
MFIWIKDEVHFQQIRKEHEDFFVLAFYGSFSPTAERFMDELKVFSEENDGLPVYVVDVGNVKGIHKEFQVTSVPTVISVEKGEVTRRVEGLENGRFYGRVFGGGAASSPIKKGEKKKSHSVTVYSGPGCPACGIAKSYLRKRGVNFREIDISTNQSAAERLVARSGQMAVPQIDIDGRLVVGFDQAKIERLLAS